MSLPCFNTRPTVSRCASALLVVLWVIALLSFLIVTTMMVAMQDVETVTSRQLVFRAKQLAEAGLAVGVHPLVKAGDPLLRRTVSSTESYEAKITTEESRLNINALLTEDRCVVLERLFVSWGLSHVDAQSVVDCLMDWVDEDDAKRLEGAEEGDYAKDGFEDRPFNRPFQSLDEIAAVRGMEMIAEVNPRWQEAFTLWGAGMLDLSEAPAELIAVVADVPLSQAKALVAARDGADGTPHTPDDQPYQSVDEALALMGAINLKGQGSPSLFTLHGSVKRVESVGRVGNYVRRISVTMQSAFSKGQSPILEWRESAE